MRARLYQWSEWVQRFLTTDPIALAQLTQPHRWLLLRSWEKSSVIEFNKAFSHIFQALQNQLLTAIELKKAKEAIVRALESEISYEQANAQCLEKLIELYEKDVAREELDQRELLEAFQALAESQHSTALFCLGWLYEGGKYIPQDIRQANIYFLQAGNRGHAFALTCFGDDDYQEHEEKSIEKTMSLLRRAVDFGDFNACYKLALLERNFSQSFLWLRQAAEEGHSLALESMGLLYERGEKVTLAPQKAFCYYHQALSLSKGEQQIRLLQKLSKWKEQDILSLEVKGRLLLIEIDTTVEELNFEEMLDASDLVPVLGWLLEYLEHLYSLKSSIWEPSLFRLDDCLIACEKIIQRLAYPEQEIFYFCLLSIQAWYHFNEIEEIEEAMILFKRIPLERLSIHTLLELASFELAQAGHLLQALCYLDTGIERLQEDKDSAILDNFHARLSAAYRHQSFGQEESKEEKRARHEKAQARSRQMQQLVLQSQKEALLDLKQTKQRELTEQNHRWFAWSAQRRLREEIRIVDALIIELSKPVCHGRELLETLFPDVSATDPFYRDCRVIVSDQAFFTHKVIGGLTQFTDEGPGNPLLQLT